MELGVWRRFRSPLLLAFIFITILHSAHCRHKIRHYKDRFKRQQGAHLYLPESYVTDGGDGADSGPWMEWSEPSPCSRTCGGGVSTQYRQCHDGYDCQGPTRRHFSCNTQDCPDTGDFRSQQCSEYDEVAFDNVKYQWVPYTKGPNPCELNCMPRGQRFYYRHAPMVVDGTRCSDTSLDVCVAGKCQPVGCDMMLGSSLKEDDCRVCGGDGSTCHTISNTLELTDMKVGYNDILLIPGGATNILVEEVLPSSNYLAIRNTSGHYYLNGNWRVDFPSSMDFAGSKFHYEREPQGFDAPDKIYTLGPIDEPLFIVLLYQDSIVPVRYKYSLPTNIQPGSEHETYAWTFDEYTQCTTTCGGGVQHRNVSCAGRKTLEPVDETLCDASRKPETSRKCYEVACEAEWVPHPWGNCSVPCGQEGGVQTREISCQQIVSNGYPSLVDDFQCQGPKPPQQQKCNEGVTCATWHLGPWKPCDHLCGDGKQTRQVTCFIKNEQGKIQVLDDAQCEPIQQKPAVEQKCFNRPCEGVDWITSEWSGCDICGLTNETRKIFCATAKGQIYGDELCDDKNKPAAVRECESNDNDACIYLWYASQWSECSSKCGKGIQTRTLFCGLSTADGVKKVDNSKCDQTRTFETMKNCTGTEECDGEWFSGPWGECSKPCGGGERTKKVVCIKGNEVVDVSHCDSDKTTFSFEECNKQECTGDEQLLPMDKNKPLTIPTEKETEATSEMSSDGTTESTDKFSTSDQISEITKSIDFTSQPQADKEDSGDDYEVVPADSCDDGEWVNVGIVEEEEVETEATETTTMGTTLETSYSIYDTMQSDASTVEETPFTGSGDGLSTGSTYSESTVEEGSGTEPTSVVTDDEDEISEATFVFSSISSSTSSDSELSTTTETSTSEVSGTSDGSTTEVASESSTSEVTSESSTSESSTSESSTFESSPQTTMDVSTTTEIMATDSTTEGSSTSDISTTTDITSTDIISTEITSTDITSTDITTTDITTTDITTTDATTPDITTTETVLPIKVEADGGTPPARVIVEEEETTTDITSTVTSSEENTSSSIMTTETIYSSEESSSQSTETTMFTSTIEASSTESTDVTLTSTDGSSMSEATSTSTVTEEISTIETTTYTGSTDYDIFSSTTDYTTTEWPTTHIIEIFRKQRMCKRKKILQCKETPYGCCWDNIHSAQGPFDKGCPTPKTCKESTYGCCPDGASAALGPKNRGCPSSHCNETLFGCCWDKKTPAQGNDDEGCPEKPPACVDSKWGCCKDNLTEAKGPKNKGCEPEEEVTSEEPKEDVTVQLARDECDKTTYGCCPDGSAAQGPQFQGCNMPCSNTTYGCCPDQVSPAHGYSGEGCCLNSAFGCCEDNISPARGPNGDGCSCEESPYGCCPDKVTSAQGYNNEGCGCKHTEYGCCPDSNTPSKGPDFQGCPCYTFQFGCCPDGITIAQGPHQQGCDCRASEFGCCSDEKTPAKGTDGAGCTCDVSKYGCCLDGSTEAKGDDFEGCDNRPMDLQASCSLPKERGSCRNYTVKWHFDAGYGGCSRFWYGGCEGNDNRFKTKEECEGVCVKPQGIDRCNLPKSNGSCGGYFVQWYYDKQVRQCTQFVYGGCLGNNNRFETRDECVALCSTESTADPCEQNVQEGPCRGQYSRYYYDKEVGECQQFAYGGCRGNSNNFATLEACQQRCAAPNKKRALDTCHLPADIGECGNYVTRWYWDTRHKRCNQFYYGGCGGNGNNYFSQQECEQRCNVAQPESTQPPPFVPTQPPSPTPVTETGVTAYKQPTLEEICSTAPDAGPCSMYEDHYYYDGVEGVCKNFTYGGCGGNYNNFADENICLQYCGSVRVTPSVASPTQAPPVFPEPQDRICQEYPDPGNCTGDYSAYYYDRNTGKCQLFAYTGCGGNDNRFSDADSCERRCGEYRGQDICNMDKDTGICKAYFPKVYYDRYTGKCTEFVYGGCGGNGNRFNSIEECQQYCGVPAPPEPPAVTVAAEKDPVNRECTAKFEECSSLRCPYGIEAYVDENECNGCRCRDPCKEVECPEGTKCSIDLNRNKTTPDDAEFIAICRENNKPGQCPYLFDTDSCDTECKTDADCTLHLKCCSTNCGTICAEPQRPSELVTQPSYTIAPPAEIYYPPKIDVEVYEPEVSGLLGDQAILNCAVSGNPNPRITWSKDNVVIDGTQARYRIRLDQTLQIITLHRTDSGVYLCIAENNIGPPLQNQIKLDVVDSLVERPVSILNIEDSELRVDNIVTSFNSPASLNCYALGWPLPAVTWWKEDELIPLKNREFEVTKDYNLLIHTVQLHNLGVYTCQAYNGKGKAASWSVTVKAKGPIYSTNPQDVKYLQYVVNPEPSTTVLPVTKSYPVPAVPPRVARPTPQHYVPEVYSTEPNLDSVDPNEIFPQLPPVSSGGYRPDFHIVPVRANITTNEHLYPTGSNVQIRCDVYGYPAPQVQWYKDGVPLISNDKISESDIHTLTIKSADKSDSGRYQCEATNQYSKASSTLDITIEGMYIPPSCTDNPFFANCKLIVKAQYCNHKYYAKFCCRSCTEAGQLAMSVDDSKQSALDTNSIL